MRSLSILHCMQFLIGSGIHCRLTNDGNAILREIEVAHPAAKSMIELSRTQDEEVGDGTTSVIILGMPGPTSFSMNPNIVLLTKKKRNYV